MARRRKSLFWNRMAVGWFCLVMLLFVYVCVHIANLASIGGEAEGHWADLARVTRGFLGDGERSKQDSPPTDSPRQKLRVSRDKSDERGLIATQTTRYTFSVVPVDPQLVAAQGILKSPVISTQTLTHVETATSSRPKIFFVEHLEKSCQNYVENPPVVRDLKAAKDACLANDDCHAIECPHGQSSQCTLRAIANGVPYASADCYMKIDPDDEAAKVHPAYNSLLKKYPFQQVTTQTGQQVNIILVRAPFGTSGSFEEERGLYNTYKNDILFLGISSFEDYPLDSMNPYSTRIDSEYFLGAFPGFLHMLHHPERHFPPHVKTILMSQSDFQLPNVPAMDLSVTKKYDFTYAATWPLGSPTEPLGNGLSECMGWSGYCKNWSFTREALHVLCGEYNLTGMLVATCDYWCRKKCAIPASCKGKITHTSYVQQDVYFDYLKKSRFAFLPQIHDASPRVATQALVLNVPILMNKHISGGWKYINEKTGEFFHDMSDFRKSLRRILQGAATGKYEPRKWVLENYGNEHAGKRLLEFVQEHFADRVHLPKNTKLLLA